MRILLRRLFLSSNLPAHRNNVRYASKTVEEEPKNGEEFRKNLIIEKYDAITTVTINRQPTRNSLDLLTMKELTVALDEFDNDKDAKVLIINGEGGTFCSGFDMEDLEEKGVYTLTDAAVRFLRRPLCDKVTIAAVSGYAVAEGFELALACDLRVIEDTAMLGFLGRRFGVPMSMFGARRITSLIGLSRALDLTITGRLISGAEASQFGLAYKATSTGTALGEAVKLAKSLAKFPQNAIIMDKLAAVNSQLNPNSEESMRDEAVLASLRGHALEDIKEGIQKFKSGIGRHGKFYKLSEVALKDWEIEASKQEELLRESPTKSQDNKP